MEEREFKKNFEFFGSLSSDLIGRGYDMRDFNKFCVIFILFKSPIQKGIFQNFISERFFV